LIRILVITISILIITISQLFSQEIYREFSGNISADYRYYLNEGLYANQEQHYPAFAIQPEFYMEWQDGNQSINFTGFFRYDVQDSKRTHFDVRELYWQKVKEDWELSIGLKKIFWGVTESVHLVDIINQTDAIESFDGEEKLGQPMVHFSYITKFGTLDFFTLLYFRKRQFPGDKGRLRFPTVIDGNEASFESSAEEYRPDFAFRWSNSIGIIDVGLSHFYGTGREPLFQIDSDGSFNLFYAISNQTGLDVQATIGPVLWKFEGFVRDNDFQTVLASAAGFEYTFGNIANKGWDLGIIGEYLFDNRDELALSSLQNDIFVGSRLALNDVQSTEILFGGIFDLEHSSRLFSVEGSRRFGQSWKAEIEVRLFDEIDQTEFLYFVREDSFLQLSLAKYF